jgi:hypothetical protein
MITAEPFGSFEIASLSGRSTQREQGCRAKGEEKLVSFNLLHKQCHTVCSENSRRTSLGISLVLCREAGKGGVHFSVDVADVLLEVRSDGGVLAARGSSHAEPKYISNQSEKKRQDLEGKRKERKRKGERTRRLCLGVSCRSR